MKHENIGTSFDSFLEEEGLLAEAEAVAVKRVIAFQIKEAMKQKKITKAGLAKKMGTSRSALGACRKTPPKLSRSSCLFFENTKS